MAIHVALSHRTHYLYDKPVGHAPHVVRLRPAPHCRTHILSYSQKIGGGEHFINWQQDPFSNWNARVVFPGKMSELSVEVELIAEMAVHNPFDFFLEESAQKWPFSYTPALKKELAPFMELPVPTPILSALVDDVLAKNLKAGVGTLDFIVALNQRLQRLIGYTIRMEPGVQTPEETLVKKSGSCRDTGWLLVQLLRSLGFAARFVSGYLIQLKSDVKALDGPSGTEVDFTDLHAWCEAYLPGAGWIGFDPTSGLLAGEGHIPLSCTPEPSNAAPITGATDKCESTMQHTMSVRRIYESPRVTKPYTDEQWTAIHALGHTIDAELTRHDVRLTMGGEPTFISIDDPDGPEWNFTAVSPKKRLLSAELLKRIRDKFAPGALLHYGQGKWYPGEPLPRWALAAFWRKDGVPIWREQKWIADEARDYGHGIAEAKAFVERLAETLRVEAVRVLPAKEDALYHQWKEGRLPSNVTPEDSKIENKDERERLAKTFSQGLDAIVGYVLPLRPATFDGEPGWTSGPWFLRKDALWLIPGNSPIGLRLPLDSLPWVAPKDYPYQAPLDPSTSRPPLPPNVAVVKAGVAQPAPRKPDTASPTHDPAEGESAKDIVRTALCVEPREGRLHIFLPPVEKLEDFLALIAAIESTATALGFPIILEGDPPPRDHRLNKLAVTPDPGVIEVNLHPSKSWDELVERTETLYEEARLTRLGTEKFMIDGRHTGTGGGNHIILGGDTTADSPILRRPDLLRSLVTYWQNHPALSWLFSGLFIGPTSQAPRVDEARQDSLYELEISFRELDRQLQSAEKIGEPPPLWLADRLFRNLLIDSTGNTHRAEFCIDKLYSPDSSTGRLGLLELRAFEMPPHARMSLAQHLVLRALVAKFWKTPYTGSLVRWGTAIHDRWMLPHFVERDLEDVLADLRTAGFDFQREWFAPHVEFRFPRIGGFVQRDVLVELRTALEPWHVLGEEGSAGSTVRYVDSSLERIQIKVRGLSGDRFIITCNGRKVPLQSTGTAGEAVAAVRYRAWQPPNCLQPTIQLHAPLTFDLYDTWNRRSLGGCTYGVAHPGGRNYDTFPINSFEAESRRLARFSTNGATQGEFAPAVEKPDGEFPYTLDLRT